MAEYILPIFISSAAVGILSYLSYPSGSERAVKTAAAIMLLYTLVSPISALVEEVSDFDAEEFFSSIRNPVGEGGEYAETAEDAFADGIERLISAEYSISADDITVSVVDFDFEKMRAGKIKVVIFGKGATADYRAIREYVNALEIGECEVRVELGK